MDDLIIQTKIIPEKNTAGILPRPHLIELLKANSAKPLIVICAGAGYGKTTLAKDFIARENLKIAWYKIDESDNNLLIFLSYLITSVSNSLGLQGERSRSILESVKERGSVSGNTEAVITTVGGTFINELTQAVKGELYIVLDDFHLLPAEDWVKQVMSYLTNYLPSNVHIIITSRESMPFDTGKLKAKRKYFEINDELRFSTEEIRELASREYGIIIKDNDIELIKKFDGWITGLHLFLQADRGKTLPRLESNILFESLYNYFAEDIFNSEKENVQSFLLKTCILEDFTANECDYLLGINNSEAILTELYTRNVFIQRSEILAHGKNDFLYNYQHLFTDFLRTKFHRQFKEDARNDIYKRTAEFYLTGGDSSSAIEYFLLAGEYENALSLINKYLDEHADNINFSTVENWLNSFPEPVKESNPNILFYKACHLRNLHGKMEDALNLFEKALELFTASGDEKGIIRTKIFIAELMIGSGKTDDAISYIESILQNSTDSTAQAKFLYLLGVSYNSILEHNKAIDVLQKALQIANMENLKEVKYSTLNDLGNIHLIQGDYAKALFYYENVVSHITNVYNKFQTITNLVQVHAYAGSFESAFHFLNEAESFVNSYSSQYFKVNYLLCSAYLHYMLCDYEKAIKIWEEFIELAIAINYNYYIFIGNLNIGICRYYLRNFDSAEKYFTLAETLSSQFDEGEAIYLTYWQSLLAKETRSSKGIEKTLLNTVKYYRQKKLEYECVHALFHTADNYYMSGNLVKAKEFLAEALALGKEKNFLTVFQKEILFKRSLFDFAVENKIETDFISNILVSLSALNEHSFYDKSRSYTGSFERLADISLQTLGDFKIKIRGAEIPEEKWVRKIRKLIFAYIMLCRKVLTKDALVDLFYPESDPENSTSTFHQTLTNIRGIIKWAVTGSEKKPAKDKNISIPEFLIYENQKLSLNGAYLYDIDVFEFEKLYKKGSSSETNEYERINYLKDALSLYKGEFLPGYYRPWCEELREKYQNYYISALEEIISILKRQKLYRELAEYSQKLIDADNLNEGAYSSLIQAYLYMNMYKQAEHAAENMKKVFINETGEEPSREVQNKIDKLLKENYIS
jgi:ATP/maltotriose-dependent transcriptional regulator MalT/DNA-binding SARP family transcriptional activator